ncbi:DinB family protein [Actinoplanes sp. LDG1-06]|uniref:DinB family protein n=1 Tax=Paractinoplanes ovalisporus TaxID=2810368 RepID=A0ABS2A8E5_9ACTN|nr:DinB family protein [Actinoplanes ovalisporus]MBM2616110.1 DinB family protein [Actinoplanes ovalisporus]
MVTAPKDVLKTYLQGARDVLLWKLDGLSEREQRLPLTPTGTNLLGLVKHALNTEVIYFGPTFGRTWPTPDELVSPDDPDPLAGWYATETETAAGITDLYRRVQAFADETIDTLTLETVGHVAHWGGAAVTLHEIMVHKTADLQRHAGHADILREQLDGSVGLLPRHSNMPSATDWPTHTKRLTAIADRYDGRPTGVPADS